MSACQRKTHQVQGLDKDLPIKFRKQYNRPSTATRQNFMNWAFGNTADNIYTADTSRKPYDATSCDGAVCPDLLGSVIIDNTGPTTPYVEYQYNGDYRNLYNGVLRFYLETYNVADVALPIIIEIADTLADLGVNSDTYNLATAQQAPAFLPYTVDLSQVPNAIAGTGWSQSSAGVAIRISINANAVGLVGLSTLDWYEKLSDVASPKLIKAYCLDALSIARTFETVTSPCADLVSITNKAIEFSITIQSETYDLYEIMAGATREVNTTVLNRVLQELTIESWTDPNTGITHGSVGLQDVSTNVCAPIDVLFGTRCADGGAEALTEILIDSPNQELPQNYFQVIRGDYDTNINNRIFLHPIAFF